MSQNATQNSRPNAPPPAAAKAAPPAPSAADLVAAVQDDAPQQPQVSDPAPAPVQLRLVTVRALKTENRINMGDKVYQLIAGKALKMHPEHAEILEYKGFVLGIG